MSLVEWIALVGVAVTTLGLVGAVVYSHASLKSDVRHMHNCLKLSLRATAKNGVRLNRIEAKLGVDKNG